MHPDSSVPSIHFSQYPRTMSKKIPKVLHPKIETLAQSMFIAAMLSTKAKVGVDVNI